ncbi:MAG: methyltransferase domain-containing protein [Calditrichaeota bacterium]|nr:methyltransferase domain-containing protein [Calditrichota bacterium]HQU73832.1 methyltransferase domain-containing protein [Calditrichia bacterium]
METFFSMSEMPVLCNVLYDSPEEARKAPMGDITLGFCETCGHVYNVDFDPQRMVYSDNYENALHFSPRFQAYQENLAERLVKTYQLSGKNIVEIGCGQGEFLALLCQKGGNRGTGFDPSYRGAEKIGESVRIFPEYFDETHADLRPDLVVCRHVLEHIDQPIPFMNMLAKTIADVPDPVIFFEVPNVLFTLRDLSVWDIIYEHVSYFSPDSLRYLFRRHRLEDVQLTDLYDGQFLGIDARKSATEFDLSDHSPDQLGAFIERFTERFGHKKATWARELKSLSKEGRTAVVWGSGSKGVTFLNLMSQYPCIEYVVDINPRKHGKFVAGTGHPIHPPTRLQEAPPAVILVMNPIYQDEITEMVREQGIQAEIMLV